MIQNKQRDYFTLLSTVFFCATTFVFCTLLICQPLTSLIVNLLPDDAFYYFKVAANIVSGYGITFDRLTPTNGFHPLWQLLLTMLFAVIHASYSRIYAALALGVIIAVGSTAMFAKILQILKVSGVGYVFCLALFALNPALIYTVNGMETAVNIFALLWFMKQYLTLALNENNVQSMTDYIWFGIAAGIVLLARLDNIFFVAFSFIFLFIPRYQAFKFFILSGVVVIIILLPYLSWNYVTFHSIVPVSGKVGSVVDSYNYQAAHAGATQPFLLRWHYFISRFQSTFVGLPLPLPLVKLAVLLLLVCIVLKRKAYSNTMLLAYILLPLWFGYLALVAYNAGVRMMFRPWYVFVGLPVLFVTLAMIVSKIDWLRKKGLKKITGAVILAILLNLISFNSKAQSHTDIFQKELTPWSLSMYRAAIWLNQNLPGQRVGSFNSGIIGYFYTGTEVDLDGVVNNTAFQYIKNKELMNYIKKAKIAYIADFGYDMIKNWSSVMGKDYLNQLTVFWVMDPTYGQPVFNKFVVYSVK